jgi:citrate synthase
LKWKTSITRVEPNRLTTRGYLQEDLIENISFLEMIHLLIKGKLPSKREAKMLGKLMKLLKKYNCFREHSKLAVAMEDIHY